MNLNELFILNKLLASSAKPIGGSMGIRVSKVFIVLSILSSVVATAQAREVEAVPGEYIVKLKPMMSTMGINTTTLGQRLGGIVKSTIPSANLLVVTRASVETQKSAIEVLSSNTLVDYAEPNYIYHAIKTPNDTDFAKQWGLKNTMTIASKVDIDAEKAWDITTGSEQVIVAIIDSGMDYNHPDLKDNAWMNEAEANGKPGVDDDNNGYVDDIHGINAIAGGVNPLDDNGHGSHCAGTIGGTGNNGLGIVGINWKVKMIGLKFLGADGAGTLEAAVKAIDYAVKMGARVLSNSWGSYGSSQALQEAIERSNKAGAIFIAASGNDGTNNDVKPLYPASYPVANVVAVAANDTNGSIAGFSNWGKKTVHLSAPGVGIHGIWKSGEAKAASGTSMAAPFVSGVAALVLAHEPSLTNLELKDRLLRTVKPLASVRGLASTGGMVNALYALQNFQAPPDENDPANWQTIPLAISSAHPYLPSTKEIYEVRVPGAKEISIYFKRFETEFQNDQMRLFDKSGKLLATLSGLKAEERFSRIVKGDYVKIEFVSDIETEAYGFEITKAAYR